MISIFGSIIIFICENLGTWTNGFNVSYKKSFLLVGGIVIVVGLVIIALQLMSLKIMRMKYQFTELDAGPLRSKIEDLMKDSKKKVKQIKVYNESKKSNSKNAFLLRLLWHREFGIADNFMLENSERELLAVLSHEVGHLKHKKNFLNYMHYLFLVGMIILLAWIIPNASMIVVFVRKVNSDFGLLNTNYYLMMAVFNSLFYFVNIFISMFQNYRSRREELEADLNAVKNGYGEELIQAFKKVSTDELIDVNPAPLIEFLDYSHPGMYQRIVYIKNAMKEMESFKLEK